MCCPLCPLDWNRRGTRRAGPPVDLLIQLTRMTFIFEGYDGAGALSAPVINRPRLLSHRGPTLGVTVRSSRSVSRRRETVRTDTTPARNGPYVPLVFGALLILSLVLGG